MEKVIEKVKIINLLDPKKVVEVEVVIDTGATMLVLPQNIIWLRYSLQHRWQM